MRLDIVSTIDITNAIFQDITVFGGNMFGMNMNNAVQIKNMTMNNIVWSDNTELSLLYVLNYYGGSASIDGLYVQNSYLGEYDGFAIDNDNSNSPIFITVKNWQFKNITVSSNSFLLKLGMAKQLVAQNVTFNYIFEQDPTDTTNMMFNIRGFDMNTTGQFSISTILVNNSSMSLMNLMNIINSDISNVNVISISDVSYINSNLQNSNTLLTFSSIEANTALNISISNILISNITFTNKGYLMIFEQQTNLTVVVTNCLFENTVNASIRFEPYNKNNPSLLTNMKFVNMTVRNSSAYFKSFMEATAGAVISIYDSVFVNNCNFLSGSVVSADSLGTSISFYNSTFQNNTSVQGGVFYVENQGAIIISTSTIQNNFAIQSGVIQASNEGRYQIYSSIISKNYGYSMPISEVLLVFSNPIIINNCTIYQNTRLTKEDLLIEMKTWIVLWFISNNYKSYIISNSKYMNWIFSMYSIHLISSNFIIENSTTIYNQDYLIDGFKSQLQFNNIIIRDSISYSFVVSMSYWTFISDNLTLLKIFANKSENSILAVLFDSVVEISNLNYSISNSTVLYAYQAQVSMTNVHLSNIQLDNNLVYMTHWTEIKLQNIKITNISSAYLYAIYISDSSANLISNVSMTNISKTGMLILNTNVTEISTLTMDNVAHGIAVQSKSTISSLHDSSFVKLGSFNVSNGGALDIIDSSVNLSSSRFEQNQAQSGAAISVRCTNFNIWINQFASSRFANNTAEVQGGAIYCVNIVLKKYFFL